MTNAKATEYENVLVLRQNGMKELYSNTTSKNVRSFFWHALKLLTVFVRIFSFFSGCMSRFLSYISRRNESMDGRKKFDDTRAQNEEERDSHMHN